MVETRLQLRAIALAAFLGLAACGPLVKSDVTRFHTFTPTPTNATFRMIPSGHQESSVEWGFYARKIEAHLTNHGLIRASEDDFRYAVMFDYAVRDRETVISSVPVFGETRSGSTAYHSGTINSYGRPMRYSGTSYTPPSYGIVGFEPRSETHYTKKLTIDILDTRQSSDTEVHKVFEGVVLSKGEGRLFSEVADCLINALFEDFPGESGETKSYVFFVSECGDQD